MLAGSPNDALNKLVNRLKCNPLGWVCYITIYIGLASFSCLVIYHSASYCQITCDIFCLGIQVRFGLH